MLQSFCGLSLEPCPCLRYAWECQTQEGGWGLDGVLREHSWKLQGIVNGMDYSEWSPEHDAHLRDDGYCNYGLDSLARGKAQCKEALQRVRGGCWGLIAGCWPVVERVLLGSRCRLLAFSIEGPAWFSLQVACLECLWLRVWAGHAGLAVPWRLKTAHRHLAVEIISRAICLPVVTCSCSAMPSPGSRWSLYAALLQLRASKLPEG